MNTTDILLVQLMEECSELQKECAKALRFGLYDKAPDTEELNIHKINKELVDIVGVVEVLGEYQEISMPPNMSYVDTYAKTNPEIQNKIDKVYEYLTYSKDVGRLE